MSPSPGKSVDGTPKTPPDAVADVMPRLDGLATGVEHQARVSRNIVSRLQRIESLLVQVDERLMGEDAPGEAQRLERVLGLDGPSPPLGARLEKLEQRVAGAAKQLDRFVGTHERRELARHANSTDDADAFFALADPLISARRTLLDLPRLQALWQAARNAARLGLPAIEAGAYRGGSAAFIGQALRHHAGKELGLHVFDTFTGHPQSSISEWDSAAHRAGAFADTDREDVEQFLHEVMEDVSVRDGDATQTVPAHAPQRLGFAHLDMDLYEPTLRVLRVVADRLAVGGVVVVDDYGAPKCPGIRDAVMEFLASSKGFQVWNAQTDQAILIRCQIARASKPRTNRRPSKASSSSTQEPSSASPDTTEAPSAPTGSDS